MIEQQPSRAIVGILGSAAVVCYAVALFLPAHFEMGLDYGGSTYTGMECLLHPLTFPFIVMEYPSWFANPLWIGSLYCLWQRVSRLAVVLGVLAVLAVALSFHDHQEFSGYWFWVVSMILAVFAALSNLLSAERFQGVDPVPQSRHSS